MSDDASPEQARCSGCRKPIVWATTAEGKKIPLDAAAPVYHVRKWQGEIRCRLWPTTERAAKLEDEETVSMVTHFATCKKADDFSAYARKGKTGRRRARKR